MKLAYSSAAVLAVAVSQAQAQGGGGLPLPMTPILQWGFAGVLLLVLYGFYKVGMRIITLGEVAAGKIVERMDASLTKMDDAIDRLSQGPADVKLHVTTELKETRHSLAGGMQTQAATSNEFHQDTRAIVRDEGARTRELFRAFFRLKSAELPTEAELPHREPPPREPHSTVKT